MALHWGLWIICRCGDRGDKKICGVVGGPRKVSKDIEWFTFLSLVSMVPKMAGVRRFIEGAHSRKGPNVGFMKK